MQRSKLTLILAESALELVPRKLWKHSAVKKHAERRGKRPGQILLDRSYHHAAMLNLRHASKRGRPDIVHFCLLQALGSPLCKEGLLRVYVHCVGDYVVEVNPRVRLPRNYMRFVGLMEQLFTGERVPLEGEALLSVRKCELSALIRELRPTLSILFDRRGEPKTVDEVTSWLAETANPLAIIGGFARGDFSETTLGLADQVVCIDPEPLDAWVVVAELLDAYERTIGLRERRIARLKPS